MIIIVKNIKELSKNREYVQEVLEKYPRTKLPCSMHV